MSNNVVVFVSQARKTQERLKKIKRKRGQKHFLPHPGFVHNVSLRASMGRPHMVLQARVDQAKQSIVQTINSKNTLGLPMGGVGVEMKM